MSATPPLPFEPLDDRHAVPAEVLRRAVPPDVAAYDELRGRDGRLRPLWEAFLARLPAGGGDPLLALDRGVEQVAQQIIADGVTHNVYSEQGPAARPWSLELLPLLVEPADWAVIERGVVQRAALVNAMLEDLYGPQRLLHDGLLPPALLFRHPGYLRPLHGVRPVGGLHLQVAAFDLARGPDGQWWVVSQRTQGPSGLGYVLHNRLIVSRMFPDAFRELRVQHIASAYRRLLDTAEALARQVVHGPGPQGQPRLVLLTPGPYNETYFEHAYLARYLGVPLVEGADLLVRGERLYLKTVDGLEPVHGVLRRLDDDYCDPLELKADSTLGVPGLLQAVRAGTVALVNPLGSGFLESPAVQGFLPAACEAMLNAPLLLPSLPTWWCGEAAAWKAVQPTLADKIVRHSYPRHGDEPTARPQDAARWAQAIDDDPEAWAVQGRLPASQAPLWQHGRVLPRPAVLRVFAIADPQGRWQVLPGGMTRVAAGPAHSVSMQRGGSSLDTWVITEGEVDTYSMLRPRLSVHDVAARRRPVASRTADNLFWLGRYTERTEQMVRLARATLMLIDGDSGRLPPPLQDALTELAVAAGLAPEGVAPLARAPALFERALLAALHDPAQQGLAFNLHALSHTAGGLRDRLSPEHWSLVRQLGEPLAAAWRDLPPDGALPAAARVLPALDRLGVQLAAITGLQSDRMTRDHGWRLLTVGRYLERLIGVASPLSLLLRHGALASDAGVELLLDLFDSTITFRARYQRHHDLLALADLLVLDTANPRAWAGVLRRLRSELGKLPGSNVSLHALLSVLPPQLPGLEELGRLDDAAMADALAALGDRLTEAGARLSDEIGRRYFAHADGGDALQRV